LKVVIANNLCGSALNLLRAQVGWTIDAGVGRSRTALLTDLADADALIVRSATRVDRELLSAAPKLRMVARAGTGVDNVDVSAATACGVLVVNSAGANSITSPNRRST
jgi:D-3-phosphoglycerate dehydrogenase